MTRVCPNPSCGHPAPRADARFCPDCGTPYQDGGAGAGGPAPNAAVVAGRASLLVQWPGGGRAWPVERAMTIGRDPASDIVIDYPEVSRRHARVEPHPSGLRLIDHQSTNGLKVGGRRVAEAILEAGTVARIGDDLGSSVSLSCVRDGGLPADGPGAVMRRPVPPEGPPRTMRLPGPGQALAIGRDGASDLWLAHPMVSWHHARVEAAGGAFDLVDLGSTNGTFVNEKAVRRHRLQPGDQVQVGPYVLKYDGTGLTHRPLTGRGVRIDVQGLHMVVKVPCQCASVEKASPRSVRRLVHKLDLAHWRGETALILNDISLTILPNEFVALVGGSGAGKSTLLRAINGFSPGTRWAAAAGGGLVEDRAHGPILVGGDDLYRNFTAYRPLIGYVPQTDIIHRTLSVGAALDYVARLRLPRDMRGADRRARIDEVLDKVDMSACRDKLVEQLSGGQLKRVSTAVELLASPQMLFLDEPTSGLDPGLDKRMMYTFRQLADEGRTVLLVTHATANIDQCDLVVFLGRGGRLVFVGPPRRALDYFGKRDYADIYTEIDSSPQSPLAWEERFHRSPEYQRYVLDRRVQGGGAGGQGMAAGQGIAADPGGWLTGHTGPPQAAGGLRQLNILTQRYFDLVRRDQRNLAILLAQAPIIGLILWRVAAEDVFLPQPDALENAFKAQPILNTMAIVAVWFGVSNAAREITKELPIYLRERMASLGILPYVFSKLGILLVLCMVQTAIMLGLVLLKTGVPESGVIFGPAADLYITLLLTALAGLATGLLLSALASNSDRAMSFTPIILVPQMILSGVTFKLEGASQILSYLTLSYWSTQALGSIVDICALLQDGQLPADQRCAPARIHIEYSHSVETVAGDWLVLAGYAVLYLALTVFFMKRKDVI